MDYEVKLEIFEGPLDLLLHLIHKNEVDIFDIPIAMITDQYLEYIDMMKALNIDIAGDFLLMASTLTHIKSKMLLPELKDDEEEDPTLEITRPLLEYMRFKEAAEDLGEREILDRDVFTRRAFDDLEEGLKEDGPHLNINIFQLMDAFKKIIDQQLPGVRLKVQLDKWSVKDKMEDILNLLKQEGPLFFQKIFSQDRTLAEFVVTFLALLELAHLGLIKVFQPTPESDIQLIPSFDETNENGDDGNNGNTT
jgi:segregation and condensation protein A